MFLALEITTCAKVFCLDTFSVVSMLLTICLDPHGRSDHSPLRSSLVSLATVIYIAAIFFLPRNPVFCRTFRDHRFCRYLFSQHWRAHGWATYQPGSALLKGSLRARCCRASKELHCRVRAWQGRGHQSEFMLRWLETDNAWKYQNVRERALHSAHEKPRAQRPEAIWTSAPLGATWSLSSWTVHPKVSGDGAHAVGNPTRHHAPPLNHGDCTGPGDASWCSEGQQPQPIDLPLTFPFPYTQKNHASIRTSR